MKSAAQTVYPRVGGGTGSSRTRRPLLPGLSPRGGGKPKCYPTVMTWRWSIPAWAGEPPGLARWCDVVGVYPRVGGGTASAISPVSWLTGLSPRGRGNPSNRNLFNRYPRSIPMLVPKRQNLL